MGSIFSRWKKKETTIEILEGIDKSVLRLEKFRRSNQELRSKIIGNLLMYSVLIYVVACTSLYFLFVPTTWIEQSLQILPVLCFPVLIYLLRLFLHWWFIRKISKNELQLQDLKEQRSEILENVMETETYKKAKEILEKFDPVTKRKLEEERRRREAPPTPATTPGTELRQRNMSPTSGTSTPIKVIAQVPATPGTSGRGNMTGNMMTPMGPVNGLGRGQRMPLTPVLPRPILRQDRSAMEKVVEYFVGDGPNNRYALICKNCYSHNGMALREEFEYIEYRCAFCRFFNPARKHRPNAPRLPTRVNSPMLRRAMATTSENEDGEKEEAPSVPSGVVLPPSDATIGEIALAEGGDDVVSNEVPEPEPQVSPIDTSQDNNDQQETNCDDTKETEKQCSEAKHPPSNEPKTIHENGDS